MGADRSFLRHHYRQVNIKQAAAPASYGGDVGDIWIDRSATPNGYYFWYGTAFNEFAVGLPNTYVPLAGSTAAHPMAGASFFAANNFQILGTAGGGAGGTGSAIGLVGGGGGAGQGGGTVAVTGGGGNTGGAGGAVAVTGGLGDGAGNGGATSFAGGNAASGSGGNATLAGGFSVVSGNGGTATVTGGSAATGSAGNVALTGGTATVAGAGGDVSMMAGGGAGGAPSGRIRLRAPAGGPTILSVQPFGSSTGSGIGVNLTTASGVSAGATCNGTAGSVTFTDSSAKTTLVINNNVVAANAIALCWFGSTTGLGAATAVQAVVCTANTITITVVAPNANNAVVNFLLLNSAP